MFSLRERRTGDWFGAIAEEVVYHVVNVEYVGLAVVVNIDLFLTGWRQTSAKEIVDKIIDIKDIKLVIAVEVLGGLAVMLGWQARVAAFLLAGFSLLSGILFHADFSDQTQTIMFLKNLALAGGFLIVVAQGAGPLSMDARRGR